MTVVDKVKNFIINNERGVIEGVAGSGKTTFIKNHILKCNIDPNNIIIATATKKTRDDIIKAWEGIIPPENIMTHVKLLDKNANYGTYSEPIFVNVGLKKEPLDKVIVIDEYQALTPNKLKSLLERANNRLYLFGDDKQKCYSFFDNKDELHMPILRLYKTYRYDNPVLKLNIQRLYNGEVANCYKNIVYLKELYEAGYKVICYSKFDVGELKDRFDIEATTIAMKRGKEYDKVVVYYDNNLKAKSKKSFLYLAASRAKKDFVIIKGNFFKCAKWATYKINKIAVHETYNENVLHTKALNFKGGIVDVNVHNAEVILKLNKEKIPLTGHWKSALLNFIAYHFYKKTAIHFCIDLKIMSKLFDYVKITGVIFHHNLTFSSSYEIPQNHWNAYKKKKKSDYPFNQIKDFGRVIVKNFNKKATEYEVDQKKAYFKNAKHSLPRGSILPFDEGVIKVWEIVDTSNLKFMFDYFNNWYIGDNCFEDEKIMLEEHGAILKPYGSFLSDNGAFYNYLMFLLEKHKDMPKWFVRKIFGQLKAHRTRTLNVYKAGEMIDETEKASCYGYAPIINAIQGRTITKTIKIAERIVEEMGLDNITYLHIDGIGLKKPISEKLYQEIKSDFAINKYKVA